MTVNLSPAIEGVILVNLRSAARSRRALNCNGGLPPDKNKGGSAMDAVVLIAESENWLQTWGLALTVVLLALVGVWREYRTANTRARTADDKANSERAKGELEVKKIQLDIAEASTERFLQRLLARVDTVEKSYAELQETTTKRILDAEHQRGECERKCATLEERNRHLGEENQRLKGEAS
jgi:hypothetical protein